MQLEVGDNWMNVSNSIFVSLGDQKFFDPKDTT